MVVTDYASHLAMAVAIRQLASEVMNETGCTPEEAIAAVFKAREDVLGKAIPDDLVDVVADLNAMGVRAIRYIQDGGA